MDLQDLEKIEFEELEYVTFHTYSSEPFSHDDAGFILTKDLDDPGSCDCECGCADSCSCCECDLDDSSECECVCKCADECQCCDCKGVKRKNGEWAIAKGIIYDVVWEDHRLNTGWACSHPGGGITSCGKPRYYTIDENAEDESERVIYLR